MNLGLNASLFQVDSTHYRNIEPRILLRYKLSSSVALKASYTRMTQYLHLLTNSGVGLPTDLWLPPTGRVPPQRSWQAAIGLAHTTEKGIELGVELFRKRMFDLLAYKEGASFLQSSQNWEDKVTSGTGESHGFELFVRKPFGRSSGWIGYTLAYADRQFADINFGKKYPFKFDRRHDLSIVLTHELSKRLHFGCNWVYGSGQAITLPRRSFYAGSGTDDFDLIYDYGEKNDFRMRPYHRLDLSLSFNRKVKWGEHSFHLSIYNVYNRRNTFFISAVQRSTNLRYELHELPELREILEEVTLLPILPSIRWDFSF